MELIEQLIARAKANKQRIVLPEGTEERTLKAANQILTDGVADLIILGNVDEIHSLAKQWGLGNIDRATLIDPATSPKKEEYAELLAELRKKKGMTIEEARNEVKGLNLSIRTIEQASEQPAGTVLSQSPDAGSTVRKSSVITLVVSTGVPEVVATPEPVEPTVNEDGTITVQESWWPSADGSHQIHQLTDGTMWNENGQRCDAQGNPIA